MLIHILAASVLFISSYALADELSSKFVNYVTGSWSNENQNTTNPSQFPLYSAEHCGVTLSEAYNKAEASAFLYQIGPVGGRRKMVFVVEDIAAGEVQLSSRRLADSSFINESFCQQPKASRIIPAGVLLESTCSVFYKFIESTLEFVGATLPEGCPSRFQGAVALHVRETVSSTQLKIEEKWLNANGEQVAGSLYGPVIYDKKPQFEDASEAKYSCWASLKKSDGTYTFDKSVIQDRGGQFRTSAVLGANGVSQSYDIRLTRVSFEDRIPVLKLSIHTADEMKSIQYNWAAIGAARIGVNSTWIQVGCTRIE